MPAAQQEALGAIVDAVSRYMIEAGIDEHDPSIIEMAKALAKLARRTRHEPDPSVPDWAQLPKAWLTPEEDALVPPRRLWLGVQDPISHYYRWVWEYLAYLQLLCGLRRESAVLEIGCSHGRTMQGLLQYLRPPGFYRGLDVDRTRLQEAQDRIERGQPGFQFIWADIYNRHYNPEGHVRGDSYVFPFDNEMFDVVYASSVFTHLLPGEVSNYFREIRRVLKPHGKCLLSFFLLDHYRGRGTTISPTYEFENPFSEYPGVAVRDPQKPDDLIGYSTQQVEALAKRGGLHVLRVIPGLWSNSSGWAVNEQDLVLLGRDDVVANHQQDEQFVTPDKPVAEPQRSRGLLAPEPSVADSESGWDAYSESWEASVQRPGMQYLGDEWWSIDLVEEIITQYVQPYLPAEAIVLEIGCGGGKYSERLAPLCKSLICGDVSSKMLERTSQRLQAFGNVRFEKLNGLDLCQFETASIDFVFSFDCFVHLEMEDVYCYLEEIRRVLTPRGRGLLHFANLHSEVGWKTFVAEAPMNRGGRKSLGWLRFLTWETVERFCEALNLRILSHDRALRERDILIVFEKRTEQDPDVVTPYLPAVGGTTPDQKLVPEAAQELVQTDTRMPQLLTRVEKVPDAGGLPIAWLTAEEEALTPPRQLWQDPHQPISHYYRWLWEYLAYLPLLCGLRRESAVLELGCSHGRTARGLLHYLRSPGYYRGIDVDRAQIEEAQKRIQRLIPAFQFVWADVYNRHWNPQGRVSSETYVFPFEAETFDVVYAASLFTHLLPEETKNYFRQSYRVLKPGGKCLFSFFVLDYYRGPGTTINPLLSFDHPWPGYPGMAVRDLEYPDAAISYTIDRLTEYAEGAGLRIVQVIPGLWSESPGLAVNEHDLVLLQRHDAEATDLLAPAGPIC